MDGHQNNLETRSQVDRTVPSQVGLAVAGADEWVPGGHSAVNGGHQTVVLAREPWRRRPGTGTSLRREKAVGAAYRYLCVPHCRPLSLPWFQPATLGSDSNPTLPVHLSRATLRASLQRTAAELFVCSLLVSQANSHRYPTRRRLFGASRSPPPAL
ncbi:hypothetical protein VTN96DRAFT_414 [Rasamsonia emersonii]